LHLHHWWYEVATNKWRDGGHFGPADIDGFPGLIQSNYNAPGNLEVVAKTSTGQLCHLWREAAQWNEGVRFANNVAQSGAAFVQSTFGKKGDFEVVCVLADGRMQHWRRQNDIQGTPWILMGTFGTNVKSSPCMIESQFNMITEDDNGNFELCVQVDGGFQHWWRDNRSGGQWQLSGAFGQDVSREGRYFRGP